MANIPDFSYEDKTPYGEVFNALANKSVKEQQMNLEAEKNRRSRVQFVMDAAKAGQDMAASAVATSAARQKAEFDKINNPYITEQNRVKTESDRNKLSAEQALGNELYKAEAAKNNRPITNSPIQQFGADGQPTTSVQPTYGSTPMGEAVDAKANILRTAAQANPAKAGEAIIENSFPKQITGSKTSSPQRLTLPDGNSVVGYYSYVDNQYHYSGADGDTIAPTGTMPAYAPVAIPNSGGGVNITPRVPGQASSASEGLNQQTGTKTTVGSYQKGELDRLDDRKKALENDEIFKKVQGRQSDLAIARSALDTNNWVGNATLLSSLAKGLGRDTGNLAAQEQERYQTSPAVIRRIATKATRWAAGDITQADKEDIREALRIADLKAKDLADRRASLYVNQGMRAVKNGDEDFIRNYIYGNKDSLDVSGESESVPSVGGTYNGQKVLKVERIK